MELGALMIKTTKDESHPVKQGKSCLYLTFQHAVARNLKSHIANDTHRALPFK